MARPRWQVPVYRHDCKDGKKGEIADYNRVKTQYSYWGYDPADVDLHDPRTWYMDETLTIESGHNEFHLRHDDGRRWRMTPSEVISIVKNAAVLEDGGRITGRWMASSKGGRLGRRFAGPLTAARAPSSNPSDVRLNVVLTYARDFLLDGDPVMLETFVARDAGDSAVVALNDWLKENT